MDHQECRGAFRNRAPLILASASPRRRRLLASVGLEFQVVTSSAEELTQDSGLAPEELSVENARLKASEVAAANPGHFILGADTIVVLGSQVLGKPRDEAHAVSMLESLMGRWHRVITGCAILEPGGMQWSLFFVESRVFIARVSSDLIAAYCRSGEPLDKAGGYAVQGAGAFMVKEIEGSWTNVVGLPLYEVVSRFQELGVIEPCLDAGN